MTLESIAWRGTNVELPADGQRVLVYGRLMGPPVREGVFARGTFYDRAEGHGPLEGVTHWADMPTGAD